MLWCKPVLYRKEPKARLDGIASDEGDVEGHCTGDHAPSAHEEEGSCRGSVFQLGLGGEVGKGDLRI